MVWTKPRTYVSHVAAGAEVEDTDETPLFIGRNSSRKSISFIKIEALVVLPKIAHYIRGGEVNREAEVIIPPRSKTFHGQGTSQIYYLRTQPSTS